MRGFWAALHQLWWGTSSAGPRERRYRLGPAFLEDRAFALPVILAGGTTRAFPAAHLSGLVALKQPSPVPALLASAVTAQVFLVAHAWL